MRRKVRGTVSGIYMYSAALGECSKRRHGSALGSSCLQQNGFCAFCLQNTPQIAYITPLAHYASACALRALCLSPETI